MLAHALAGAAILVQAWLLSRTISRAFLEQIPLSSLRALIIALAGVIVLRALLTWTASAGSAQVSIRTRRALRSRYLAHVHTLGPAFTHREQSGDLVIAATEGIEKLDGYFRDYLPAVFTAIWIPLLILVVVFPLDHLTFLILLLTGPLIPVFMALIGSAAGALARQQFGEMRVLGAHFVDVMQGLTTLKIFNRSRHQVQTIARVTERFREATMRVLRIAFLSSFALELIATLSVAIVAVEIGLRLLNAGIAFEKALFLLVIAPEFYMPLRNLGARFHNATEGKAAAERLFTVLDASAPTEPAAPTESAAPSESAAPGPRDEASPRAPAGPLTISFEDVGLVYPDAPAPALDGISLTIRAGERVAIIGPSGSGKSSLASILLRFHEPTSGRIRVNGENLESIPVEEWREHIGWSAQIPWLFFATVAENIRLGRPSSGAEEIVAAARTAGAHEFITRLPEGYDTLCGEHGLRLSGGQAQRIALARALLRDAPLLILDEPTSQLDPENEESIMQALSAQPRNNTLILITHRLDTARHADRVIVLKEGRVASEYTNPPREQTDARGPALRQPAPTEQLDYTKPVPRAENRANAAASPADHAATAVQTLARLGRVILPFWPGIALSVLLGVFTIGSSIALMATSAWLISTAALQPSIAALNVAIVGVRFFGIARAVFRYLERLASHSTTFRILAHLRVAFYEALEPLAPARLVSLRTGDLLGRVVDDVESLQNFYLRTLAPPLVAFVIMVGFTFFLALFNPSIAAAALIFMLLAGVGVPWLAAWGDHRSGERRVQLRAELNGTLVDSIQGLAETLVYGQSAAELGRVDEIGASLQREEWHAARYDALQGSALLLLANAAAVTVLAVAIPRIEGVLLATVVLATVAAFEAFGPLAQAAVGLGANIASARRLFEIVDMQPAVVDPPNPAPPPKDPTLTVENLAFRYAPDEPWVLRDLTLTLHPGERIAIMGESGAGKSTLVNVLLRFWEYERGSVRLGETELQAIAQTDVRDIFSVLSQRTHLFNTSVRENIRIARPAATDAEVAEAAQSAQIHERILALPDGYETFVGEDGVQLSGGERQRVALARALLRDAPILILDEATANLDPETEQRVMRTVLDTTKGRSLLVLTHRRVFLDEMDEVIQLAPGTA